jgi:hypothetical protein
MIPVRLALLTLTLPMVPCFGAKAQTSTSPVTAHVQEPRPPGGAAPDDEIVVTAPRYGEARVGAETEFGEDEIAGQGVDSIQELMARLKPFIDPSGEEPVILINGRPADGDQSILSYPPEALSRFAVLKPEAAAQYGYAPRRRVVNLVLKKHFSSLNLDASGRMATAGGQYGGNLSAGRVAIDGPSRWNVQLRISGDSALRKSARDIPAAPGIFDGTGYVAALNGGEIDPALSLAAGNPVTLAGIPSGAGWQAPLLADFAATAGRADPVDPNRFETLQPARRSLNFGAGVTRPIGDFSATLAFNATSTDSKGQRGLPMGELLLPGGNPWSPFTSDVLLVRPFAGTSALRNDNSTRSLGGTLLLAGRLGGWVLTFSGGYARNWTDSRLDQGIDIVRAQALLDAGDPGFNPFGRWDSPLLRTSRNRSNGSTASARLNVIKTVIDLPAGPFTANATINYGRNALESRSSMAGEVNLTRRRSDRLDGQVAFNLPIFGRDKGKAGPIGELQLDLLAGAQKLSGGGLQKRYAAGFTWTPLPLAQLRGTLENSEAAPSAEQLDAPIVTTINRIYDYVRQEAVDAVWITGGNPGLGRGRRQNRTINALLRPLKGQELSVNLGYSEQVARGGVAGFPQLTPAIEAAFPERVVRDAGGRLVSIDARAINLARDTSAELRSGFTMSLPRRGPGALPKPGISPLQWTFSLNYRRRLKSTLLTRVGLPVIDLLDSDGGQSRDSLSGQLTVGKRGAGGTLNGNWTGAARLRNAATTGGDYRFEAWSSFDLSLFAEPEHLLGAAGKAPWLKNLRLSLDVRNLLNGYRQVRLADGSIPFGYGRDQIDPLGRTARITLRKRF